MPESKQQFKVEDFNIKLVKVSIDLMSHDEQPTIKVVTGLYRDTASRFHDGNKSVKKTDLGKISLLGEKVVIFCRPEHENDAIALARNTLKLAIQNEITRNNQLLEIILREPIIEKKFEEF